MLELPARPPGCPWLPVIPVALDVPQAFRGVPHQHAEAQLVYACQGVVRVSVAAGTYVVPPQRAVWVPPGVEHHTSSRAAVRFRTLYFPPHSLPPLLPEACAVVEVSELMRALILRCVSFATTAPTEGFAVRVLGLLFEEFRVLPAIPPLCLGMPVSPRLLRLAESFLETPTLSLDIDTAAARVGLSRRTFLRQFQGETGLSFGQWRQQALVLASLSRLAAGESVLGVALDLGYQSPSAFSAMFRRVLGVAPREYFVP
ncbi:AraC family transcriptional regulator [Pararhodospirillum photometricum]|nr:helix-turn-helix transcriptional regulator [Pararhodospirillum photometricum]